MPSLEKIITTLPKALFSKDSWKTIAEYVGLGVGASSRPLTDSESLRKYLYSRASHVAQTSLYGYLKTRAGTRFPEMFENPELLLSMNMAKWQVWLACISDLSVYVGGLIHQRTNYENDGISKMLLGVLEKIFADTGKPEDSDENFLETVEEVKTRITNIDYSTVTDNELAFIKSPEALYRWGPIASELKSRDKEVVINSVRFRWQEIRRSCRKLLDAESVMRNPTNK